MQPGYQHRQVIMTVRQEGLTKTYNRFHDEQEIEAEIVLLRELHRKMDEAVARACGWHDLKLEDSFHETKQDLRYTISERGQARGAGSPVEPQPRTLRARGGAGPA